MRDNNMARRFRALRVAADDKRVKAALVECILPPRDPAHVLIEVHYSSINYKDALAITGRGKIMQRLPLIAGVDAAGIILESDDARFKTGQPVLVTGYELSQNHDGGLAEYLQVPADWVVPLPDGLSLFAAMALGTAGFTAALSIQRMQDNGQTAEQGPIIVTGASGGVGSIAIDCLSNSGFEVVALTGKPATDYLHALGAARSLDRKTMDFGTKPLEKAVWAGAIDTVGGDILAWLTRTLLPNGNIASCGLAGGYELHTTVMPFILRGVNLLGINSAATAMPLRAQIWQRLASDIKPRHLDLIVTETVTLDGVFAVCERMLAGQTHGRYVVAVRK
jgi:acrylyl-CoA reductase (NADPH)